MHASNLKNLEVGSQKSELRSRNSELRSRNSEVGTQKSELRSRNSEVALLGHRRVFAKFSLWSINMMKVLLEVRASIV